MVGIPHHISEHKAQHYHKSEILFVRGDQLHHHPKFRKLSYGKQWTNKKSSLTSKWKAVNLGVQAWHISCKKRMEISHPNFHMIFKKLRYVLFK